MTSKGPVLFLKAHGLLIVLGGILIALSAPKSMALGFAIGAGLAFVNSAGLVYAWPRILERAAQKKTMAVPTNSIALPIAIVVSKFALSIGVLYWVTRPDNPIFGSSGLSSGLSSETSSTASIVSFPLMGLLAGMATVIPATIAGAWFSGKAEQETE